MEGRIWKVIEIHCIFTELSQLRIVDLASFHFFGGCFSVDPYLLDHRKFVPS